MIVKNVSRDRVICPQAELADSFFARMRGLLGRRSLSEGQGLIITRCNSVHMLFMKFSIDVMFIDPNGLVVGMAKDLRPFQLSRIYWTADRAIELPSGTLTRFAVSCGDQITVTHT